mmetsp:Transcript_122505/g.261402  ORF Transcript_122505/g.261402 Transcript_122505/m.261402 type:complete len:261 (+) Transcript_122505:168-950(+)
MSGCRNACCGRASWYRRWPRPCAAFSAIRRGGSGSRSRGTISSSCAFSSASSSGTSRLAMTIILHSPFTGGSGGMSGESKSPSQSPARQRQEASATVSQAIVLRRRSDGGLRPRTARCFTMPASRVPRTSCSPGRTSGCGRRTLPCAGPWRPCSARRRLESLPQRTQTALMRQLRRPPLLRSAWGRCWHPRSSSQRSLGRSRGHSLSWPLVIIAGRFCSMILTAYSAATMSSTRPSRSTSARLWRSWSSMAAPSSAVSSW